MRLIESSFSKFERNSLIDTDELHAVFNHMASERGRTEVAAKHAACWVNKVTRRLGADRECKISFSEFMPICLRGPFQEIFEQAQ